MSKVLVTGAGGYIGTQLVSDLLKAGHEVTAVDRFFFGENTLKDFKTNSKLSIVKKDIEGLEKDIKEVELGKNREVNDYLASFENSYLYKVGFGRESFIQFVKMQLGDDLKYFNKILGGFEWLIANKNPDGITVINIGRRLSIKEKIVSQEENQLQNANKNK